MAGSRYSIGAVHDTSGEIQRYGRHRRTGKFYKWSSKYGRLLRSRGKLDAHVTREQRDEFKAWARAKSLVPRSKRVNLANPPMRLRALREARTLLGTVERGGNNTGPVVDRIIRENDGAIGEPWCGDFAAYVYRRAGSKAVQRGWASTPLIGRLAGMRILSSYLAGKPGDLVVFNFPGGGADSDHVGLLVAYTDANGKKVAPALATHIRTLDGNVGSDKAVSDSATGNDGVEYVTRPLTDVNRVVRVLR